MRSDCMYLSEYGEICDPINHTMTKWHRCWQLLIDHLNTRSFLFQYNLSSLYPHKLNHWNSQMCSIIRGVAIMPLADYRLNSSEKIKLKCMQKQSNKIPFFMGNQKRRLMQLIGMGLLVHWNAALAQPTVYQMCCLVFPFLVSFLNCSVLSM